jgi:hypothetical protein
LNYNIWHIKTPIWYVWTNLHQQYNQTIFLRKWVFSQTTGHFELNTIHCNFVHQDISMKRSDTFLLWVLCLKEFYEILHLLLVLFFVLSLWMSYLVSVFYCQKSIEFIHLQYIWDNLNSFFGKANLVLIS